MEQAAEKGDIFVTVTGCDGVIRREHFSRMKDGAILTNAGHFDVEVDMQGLRELAVSHYTARQNIEGYVLPNGRTLFVLAEGPAGEPGVGRRAPGGDYGHELRPSRLWEPVAGRPPGWAAPG